MPHIKLPYRTVYSDSAQYLRANLLLSCPTLCSPMDCSPPGSSVRGILQARIPEWVAMSFSRGSSTQGSNPYLVSPALAGRFFTTSATRDAHIELSAATI